MPYTKGASNATGPYIVGGTQTYQQANNAEYQYDEATQSLEQDLLTAFVLSGLVATKDGSVASQLDVTAGVAFLTQTDNTLRRRAPTSSTQSSAGHPGTTLFLDLNPDGTWSWGTAHSGVTNYLPIASVTTDGSSNILAVSDVRQRNTTILSGLLGTLQLPSGTLSPAPNPSALALFGRDSGGTAHQGVYINAADGVTQVTGYDTTAGVTRTVREFVGTVDPSGVTTMNEGDRWYVC